MTPVIPWSTSYISIIAGAAFTLNKNNLFTRCSLSRKPTKRTSCSQRLALPVPTFATSFPRSSLLHRSIQLKVSATGTDVTVEEPYSPVLDEGSSGTSETQADAGETTETSPDNSDANPASAQSRRARPPRKSEMPPVKSEDLIPGAMFTGKVRSIQPFGAFVDFGAFTDGLVHVSRLSDSFVKDVGNIVSIGLEVQVRLIEANTETGRISLSMRESDDPAKLQQQKDTPTTGSSDKPRPSRRNTERSNQKREEAKSSKFVKGQELEGIVKNLTRSGSFISLPEGDEGFLPSSEESDDGLGSMMGSSSLEVGQEVSVRVLRISRGQVTLTMKKEVDEKLDVEFSQGVVHAATNPFVLAFRQNKDIAAFLDDREIVEKSKKKAPEEVGSQVNHTEVASDVPEVQDQPASSDEESVCTSTEAADANENVDSETTKSEEKEDEWSAVLDLEGSASTVGESIVETPTDLAENSDQSDLSAEIASEVSSLESPVSEEIVEIQPTAGDDISSATSVENDDTGATSDENGSIVGSNVQEDSASPQEVKDQEENVESTAALVDSTEATVSSSESQAVEEIAEKLVDTTQDDAQIQTPAAETETTVSEKQAVEQVVTGEVEDIKEQVQVQAPAAETETTTTEKQAVESTAASVDSTEFTVSSSESQAVEEIAGKQVDTTQDDGQIPTPAAETETTVSEKQAVEQVVIDKVEDIKEEVQVQAPAAETETTSTEKQAVEEFVQNQVEDTKEVQIQTPAAENGTPEKVESTPENATKATISPALVKQLREETGAGMMDCKKALSETAGDIVKAQEYLRMKGLASAEKKASRATAEGRIGSYIHDSRIGVLVEVNCETDFVSRGEIFKELVDDIAMQVAACPQIQHLVTEDVPEEIVNKEREIEMQKEDLSSKPEQIRAKIVEGRIRKRLEELVLLEQPYIKNDKVVLKDWVKQTIATIGENIKVKRFVRYNLGEGLEKKSQDFAAEVAAQTSAKPAAAPAPANEQPAAAQVKETEKKPAVAVSAALVKQLREETGAGMMDCKKALSETEGDLEKAQEYLRKKGLSTADKKSSRLAAEGRIGAYIHDSRIGVLIEVNCETDFVGRSENFKELVGDLAMQVVACPQVQFVSIEDIPEEIVKKEKEVEMQREDLASKPENIRERIVEGRVSKRLGELTLLEQPFIKNDSILVKDLVKQTVAALGENIKVRRFVRFTLGQTTETES